MPLDAKAVEQKGRDLSKAAESSSDAAGVLRLLSELKTGVLASENLLRTTKIGVAVNKLKQHSNPQVKQLAGELVSKWRNDVQRLRPAVAGGSGTGSGGGSGASTPKPSGSGASAAIVNGSKGGSKGGSSGVSSPAAGGTGSSPKGAAKRPDVPKDKRNSKTDGVNWKVTGNPTRDNCVKLMYDGLAFMSEELPDVILSTAGAVESATYTAYSPESSEPYKSRIRSLYQNLRSKTNGALRTRVLAGDIAPARLVKMTHEELKSEERKAEDAKMMKENMDKAMVAQEEQSISTHLRCGKCNQKKVTYTQAQTRSADEPMTTFCTCLNCGNRWKFS